LDDDVEIKLVFTFGMVSIYAITFLTQKLDTATTSSLLSGFTNALIGLFAYNWMKRKTSGGSTEKDVSDNVSVRDGVNVASSTKEKALDSVSVGDAVKVENSKKEIVAENVTVDDTVKVE